MRKAWIGVLALASAGCSAGNDLPLAQAGAEKVHAQINAGKCAEIRDTSASDFKEMSTAESWGQVCALIADRLGKHVSSAQAGWRVEYRNGDHLFSLNLDSQFEKAQATEQFLFRVAGGRVALVGYHVNSPAFMVLPPGPTPGATPPAAPAPK